MTSAIDDLFAKRPVEKSPEEQEYERLCEQYEVRFGRSFGYSIGGYAPSTTAEAIEEVKKCLETGVPQKKEEWNGDPNIVL